MEKTYIVDRLTVTSYGRLIAQLSELNGPETRELDLTQFDPVLLLELEQGSELIINDETGEWELDVDNLQKIAGVKQWQAAFRRLQMELQALARRIQATG